MSSKGSPQLCINGFTFTRHIVKDDTIYWRCTQFRALRCPARHRQRRGSGALEVVWAKHNHGLLERRKRGSLREILLQRKNAKQLYEDVKNLQSRKITHNSHEQSYTVEYLMEAVKEEPMKY